VGVCERKAVILHGRLAIERYVQRLRRSPGREQAALQVGEIDRQRGIGAGIAVRCARAEHDHGRRQRQCHDVSHENGWGLHARGTVAIGRMVPPQSGQMAKSAAVIGRSLLVRLSVRSGPRPPLATDPRAPVALVNQY
jgi:hypothetical protein